MYCNLAVLAPTLIFQNMLVAPSCFRFNFAYLYTLQETSISLSWPTVDRLSVVKSCYSQLLNGYLLPYIIFRIISYYVLREQAGTLAPPKSDIHKVRYNCNPLTLKQLSILLEEGVVSQAAFLFLPRHATQRGALRDETKTATWETRGRWGLCLEHT